MLFNIMYVHSMERLRTEHRAFIEQILRFDDYELQIFENWNQRWFTESCGDCPRRSRTRIVAVFRNMEEPLRAAMEYLQCCETNTIL